MKTKNQIIAELKELHPTLKIGDDTRGYTELNLTEYETTINSWADVELTKLESEAEAEAKATAKAAAQAKLAALGLTVEDLTALGL